ncbi:MAG: M24 family metallopeptidase [Chloroflexus sp.]|uniref:M24 family metallopeptidase n=1 Tax=Chloroflexus sp. TaxID=1904827 RepID=UPI00404A685E
MTITPIEPSLRRQADVQNQWLAERLAMLLPALMERTGIDLWIVVAREYNEDPVIMTLLPAPAMNARRRTILIFARRDDGVVDRLTLDRYGYGDLYQQVWNPDTESQDDCLARIVGEYNPQRIGIDTSATFAFADGLSHHEHERLLAALGPLAARCVSAEPLVIGWLERRIPAELAVYTELVALGHRLIAIAFSRTVITPGITTTDDVVWWLRQTMHEAGLRAWFQPTVSIQARGMPFNTPATRNPIWSGDLLHCDVGFCHLGLCTDQQQHAYVLARGETAPPPGLVTALAQANHLQDIVMAEMQVGRTGNQVLAAARERAINAGLQPSIYSHPLGFYGHAAGPTIGLWDRQDGVPGAGDYPLYDETVYAIELNNVAIVPEWDDQPVRIALEEDAVLTSGRMEWLHGRQTQLHVIE